MTLEEDTATAETTAATSSAAAAAPAAANTGGDVSSFIPFYPAAQQPKGPLTLKAVQAKNRGFRSSLSGKLDDAKEMLATADACRPTASMLRKLEKQLAELEEAHSRAEWAQNTMDQLDTRPLDHKDRPKYDEQVEKDYKATRERKRELMQMIAAYESDLEQSTRARETARPAQPVAQSAALPKSNAALKPPRLTRDATPVEMKMWEKQYRAYHLGSQLDKASVTEQQFYLKNCLDVYLASKLDGKIREEITPIFPDDDNGEKSCMEILHEEFTFLHPIPQRRYDFFKEMPKEREDFLGFMERLQKMGDEADLTALTTEDIYVFRFITTCPYNELRRDFIKEQDALTMKRCFELTKNYMISRRTDKTLQKENANAVNRGRSHYRGGGGQGGGGGGGRGRSHSRSEGYSKFLDKLKDQGKCFKCGNAYSQKHNCKKQSCDYCEKDGHNASVCYKKSQDKGQSANAAKTEKKDKKKKKKAKAQAAEVSSDSEDEELSNAVTM